MAIAIVSSRYSVNGGQKDGRHYVTETHILDDGSDPVVSVYLAEVGENYQAHLDAMAAALVDHLNRPPDPPDDGGL